MGLMLVKAVVRVMWIGGAKGGGADGDSSSVCSGVGGGDNGSVGDGLGAILVAELAVVLVAQVVVLNESCIFFYLQL